MIPSVPLISLAVVIVAAVLMLLLRREDFLSHQAGGMIERYSKDITAMAKRGELDPIIGREEEIRRVIQTLGRRKKDNVVLVGNAGVGKTAIVEGLAEAIVAGKAPSSLSGKRVLSLDLNSLVAGTKYRGDFESRMLRIADEIRAAKRRIILFIDEIHNLTEAGAASGALNAGDILKPALARGELQVVGATTPIEYEKYIKQDTTLERRLQPILVRELSVDETLAILRGIKTRYEQHHQVILSDEALESCISLASQYLPDRCFPDKAIDLMDESASRVRLANVSTNTEEPARVVQRSDVEAVVAAQVSVNIF